MGWLYAGRTARFEELAKPFVLERFDHLLSLACCATRNNLVPRMGRSLAFATRNGMLGALEAPSLLASSFSDHRCRSSVMRRSGVRLLSPAPLKSRPAAMQAFRFWVGVTPGLRFWSVFE